MSTGKLSGSGAELFFKLSISRSISFSVKLISVRHGWDGCGRSKNVNEFITGWVSSGWENAEEY